MLSHNDNNDLDFGILTPQVVNVVGSMTLILERQLKLKQIAIKCHNSQYNPKRFNGLIWRVKKPKATFLLFSNGKAIITGSRSQTQFQLAARKLCKKLVQIGAVKKAQVRDQPLISNVVSTVNTRLQINLQKMNRDCHIAQHEPSAFPGLVYRMKTPETTFLVFSTGKVVITGSKSEKSACDSFRKFYKVIKKFQKKNNQNYQ